MWWVGRGMVRATAAGGDAVKPSGKSSVGHQHTRPQDRRSPQVLELELHLKQEKSLMLLL